jgi:hypothetical protein
MSWGRRIVLLFIATIGATLLGIALSAAFARPAGAATLPLSTPPIVPPSVAASPPDLVDGVVTAMGSTANPPNIIAGAGSATGTVVGPLPSLPVSTPPAITAPPVPGLPVPELPIVIVPITKALTTSAPSPATPSGAGGAGLGPSTGGPSHGSTDAHRGTSAGRTGATTSRSAGSSVDLSSASPLRPLRIPAHRLPVPSSPGFPSNAGDSVVPGHGSGSWNALPLALLLLGALGLGTIFLRRRLSPKLLFGSRFAPPG